MESVNLGADFWVSVFFQVLGVIIFLIPVIWKMVKAPIEHQVNGFGERLKTQELTCTQHTEKISNLEGNFRLGAQDRGVIHERLAALEDRFDRFLTNAESDRKTESKDASAILQRLAAIEAKVDIGAAIKEAFIALGKVKNDTR